MAGSFKAIDYKKTVNSGGEWFAAYTYNNPVALTQGGLGYIARLSYSEQALGQSVGASAHKGSASFILLPAVPMYYVKNAYTTSINVQYVHNKNLGSLSVSFDVLGAGVSVDVFGLSDSVAKSLVVYYTR